LPRSWSAWIDRETLLPLKHVIRWEGLTWTEFYNYFTLNPKVDVKAFELPR
jgi:hypothetical protein